MIIPYPPTHPRPSSGSPPPTLALFFVLLEASGAHPASVSVALEETLGGLFESGLVLDGVVASSDTQRAQVWQVREGISEALRHRGAIYKYDLSFRLPEMYGVVEEARRRVEQAFPDGDVGGGGLPAAVVGYGHLGDGNVHLNISGAWVREDPWCDRCRGCRLEVLRGGEAEKWRDEGRHVRVSESPCMGDRAKLRHDLSSCISLALCLFLHVYVCVCVCYLTYTCIYIYIYTRMIHYC